MSAKPNASPSPKHRILLVDDHAVVREGFVELINSNPAFRVCGEAANAAEALDAVRRHKPDVALVDLSLQGGNGLELIKNLQTLHPRLPILVLSMHDENLYAGRALRAGALGYVMKREPSKTVLTAIRTVLKGGVFVSPSVRNQMLHQLVGGNRPMNPTGLAHLSDRELEVFQLLGEGRTTRQIAQQLRVSTSTVETHRAHLKEKLNLRNAAELMRAAVERANRS